MRKFEDRDVLNKEETQYTDQIHNLLLRTFE